MNQQEIARLRRVLGQGQPPRGASGRVGRPSGDGPTAEPGVVGVVGAHPSTVPTDAQELAAPTDHPVPDALPDRPVPDARLLATPNNRWRPGLAQTAPAAERALASPLSTSRTSPPDDEADRPTVRRPRDAAAVGDELASTSSRRVPAGSTTTGHLGDGGVGKVTAADPWAATSAGAPPIESPPGALWRSLQHPDAPFTGRVDASARALPEGAAPQSDRERGVIRCARSVFSWLRLRWGLVGVIAVVALVFVSTQLLKAESSQVPVQVSRSAPSPSVTPSAPPHAGRSAGAPTTAPTPAATQLQVHVVGLVARPGVVRLEPGARVADALRVAGGATGGAQLGDLNLAQPVQDGSQLVIGPYQGSKSQVRTTGSGGGAATAAPSAGASSATGGQPQVDLNSATVEQLEALPGVGPVMAKNIIGWRDQHGRFSSVNELREIDGIGPKTFAKLSAHVRV